MEVSSSPAKVKLLSQKFFRVLERLDKILGSFSYYINVSQSIRPRVLGRLEKVLGKSIKFLKRLLYYPNEFSDDP